MITKYFKRDDGAVGFKQLDHPVLKENKLELLEPTLNENETEITPEEYSQLTKAIYSTN